MPRHQLMELFVDELKRMYWAEHAVTRILSKMVNNATAPELAKTLRIHVQETDEHAQRIERVFQILGEKASARKCETIAAMVKEIESAMENSIAGPMCDAAIVLAASKVEHYKIATYRTLVAFGNTLGLQEAADLLEVTLDNEMTTDEVIIDVTASVVNIETEHDDVAGPEEEKALW